MKLYALPLFFAAGPLMAAEPYCAVEKTCVGIPEECQEASGRLVITALDAYKATVQLDDGPVHESAYLNLNKVLTLIFRDGDIEHQLRIQDSDGSFNYVIATPDPEGRFGKDRFVYHGTCVEG